MIDRIRNIELDQSVKHTPMVYVYRHNELRWYYVSQKRANWLLDILDHMPVYRDIHICSNGSAMIAHYRKLGE